MLLYIQDNWFSVDTIVRMGISKEYHLPGWELEVLGNKTFYFNYYPEYTELMPETASKEEIDAYFDKALAPAKKKMFLEFNYVKDMWEKNRPNIQIINLTETK